MSKLRLSITMSLDGYVAGPDQTAENPLGLGGMELHQWFFPLREFRDMQGASAAPSLLLDRLRRRSPAFGSR